MAALYFDDESETGFHWSARTSHHFFVKLGPSWLNDCLQGVEICVVTSWNIPLQNRPNSIVHGINIRAWGCHICLPRNPPDSVQPRLTDIQSLKDRCVSWSIILYEDLLVFKSFCESSKKFFLQHVQINLAVDFQAIINEHQTRFAHVWCNSSPNHIANRFLVSKLTSDVDWWVSRAMGINFIILLIGHSLHRGHLLVGPNEDLAGGWLHFP